MTSDGTARNLKGLLRGHQVTSYTGLDCPVCGERLPDGQIRRLAGSPGENALCAHCGIEITWSAWRLLNEQ